MCVKLTVFISTSQVCPEERDYQSVQEAGSAVAPRQLPGSRGKEESWEEVHWHRPGQRGSDRPRWAVWQVKSSKTPALRVRWGCTDASGFAQKWEPSLTTEKTPWIQRVSSTITSTEASTTSRDSIHSAPGLSASNLALIEEAWDFFSFNAPD